MRHFPYQLTPIFALCALSKSLPNCSLKSVWAILAFWPLSKSLPNCSLKSDDVNPSCPSTPPPAPAAPVAPFPTPAPLPPPPLPLSSSSGVVMMILVAFEEQDGVKRLLVYTGWKKIHIETKALRIFTLRLALSPHLGAPPADPAFAFANELLDASFGFFGFSLLLFRVLVETFPLISECHQTDLISGRKSQKGIQIIRNGKGKKTWLCCKGKADEERLKRHLTLWTSELF